MAYDALKKIKMSRQKEGIFFSENIL